MGKRRSVESEACKSKKSHRNDSSSSSTSGEWLCASTRVPLPGEALNFSLAKSRNSTTPSTSKRKAPKPETAKGITASHAEHCWLPFACSAAASFLLHTPRHTSDEQPRTSPLFSASRKTRTIKVSELRHASLLSHSSSSNSSRLPLCKTSVLSDPEKLKWPSFPSLRRKSAVLDFVESPQKNAAERTPSPEGESSSTEPAVEESQEDVFSREPGNSEGGRSSPVQRIETENRELCTPTRVLASETMRSSKLVSPKILESSPDEVAACSPMKSIISTPAKSDASNEVPATQDVVTESDDGEHPPSERFYVDEGSRLHSSFPSAEKHEPDTESGEDSDSSDDEEEFTHKNVMKMNLSGIALEFAEYMLARQSERAIAKRDRDLPTFTYEVEDTISAWGMSISWLLPKAIMYAPPFVRDPTTVTLALPLETLTDESDPETPIIVNPIIVATTQQVVGTDSTEK
ncbi:hypothetical protein V3C99_004234 [Haemonchus contortus]